MKNDKIPQRPPLMRAATAAACPGWTPIGALAPVVAPPAVPPLVPAPAPISEPISEPPAPPRVDPIIGRP